MHNAIPGTSIFFVTTTALLRGWLFCGCILLLLWCYSQPKKPRGTHDLQYVKHTWRLLLPYHHHHHIISPNVLTHALCLFRCSAHQKKSNYINIHKTAVAASIIPRNVIFSALLFPSTENRLTGLTCRRPQGFPSGRGDRRGKLTTAQPVHTWQGKKRDISAAKKKRFPRSKRTKRQNFETLARFFLCYEVSRAFSAFSVKDIVVLRSHIKLLLLLVSIWR